MNYVIWRDMKGRDKKTPLWAGLMLILVLQARGQSFSVEFFAWTGA